MVKINLIGNYNGRYRVSVLEWVLVLLNLMLLVTLTIWALGEVGYY